MHLVKLLTKKKCMNVGNEHMVVHTPIVAERDREDFFPGLQIRQVHQDAAGQTSEYSLVQIERSIRRRDYYHAVLRGPQTVPFLSVRDEEMKET